MAVEILILSGARQGERLVLDKREFQAGSDARCEVLFDARTDPAIYGRSAMFRCQEDGWSVRCAGGQVLVNQQPVTGWMRIRSGDVVRMSESGPDFSFSIVTGATALAARASAEKHVSPLSDAAVVASPIAHVPTPPVEATPVFAAGCQVDRRDTAASASAAKVDRRWAIWASGGLAVAIMVLLVGRSLLSPPTIVVNLGPTGAPSTTLVGTSSSPTPASGDRNGTTGHATNTGGEVKKPPTAPSPPTDPAARLGGAVYLLQVEKAGRSWPFATCVAVSPDTLLTTAREVALLAKWREEGEFKIWVTQPAHQFKEEVQDLRINGVFASLAKKPGDWVYYNLGLLTVRAKLPEVAALASQEELAGLEEGMPLAVFGYFHEGEKTTRFDKLEPQLASGKIYVITVGRTLPGQPRLLHAKAVIPNYAYGSPVVSAQGTVLGVYSEAAAPATTTPTSSAGQSMNLHYMTVVAPEMINLWLQKHDAKVWPPATAALGGEKTQDSP
jgi:hypothetical protein